MNTKNIITIAFALMFVITGLFAVFSAGRLVNQGLDYALGVERCTYIAAPDPDRETKELNERCEYDKNNAKRETAESLAILLVTAPFAVWASRRFKK